MKCKVLKSLNETVGIYQQVGLLLVKAAVLYMFYYKFLFRENVRVWRVEMRVSAQNVKIDDKSLICSSGLGQFCSFIFCHDDCVALVLWLLPTTIILIILPPSIHLHLSIFLCCFLCGKASRAGNVFLISAYIASSA